jgi:hypothetical protein
MRHANILASAIALVAGLALAQPALSQTGSPWTDDFNRPNGPIGGNWTAVNAPFSINNNRGTCNAGTDAWIRHTLATGEYLDMEVAIDFLPKVTGSSFIYVGFAVGLLSSWESIFVKLQDNNADGFYDRLFFEPAINAGTGWTSAYFFDLATPTASGRMKLHFSNDGDVAIVDIDNNFDGVIDESFQSSGILAANLNLGSDVAVCCFGSPAFDNFYCRDVSLTAITSYCTAGTTTHGCVPAIAGNGVPSATATSGFTISVNNVEGQRAGLIFYGMSNTGWSPTTWGNGSTSYLCVKAPTQRTPTQNSGGSLNACNGVFALDWNAFISATPNALGVPFTSGQVVWAQAWFRDPAAPKTTNLSNGLTFHVQP